MDIFILAILLSTSEAYIFSSIWFSKRINNNSTPRNEKLIPDVPHLWAKAAKRNPICTTDQCKTAAEALRRNMKPTVDPCQDFYEFACGGWAQAHPMPPTESSWGQFDVAADKNLYEIKDILESDVDLTEPSPMTAIKMVYQTCMKKDGSDNTANVKPLLELTTTMGRGWPMISGNGWKSQHFVWYETAADITSQLFSPSVFAVFVTNDRKNTGSYVITVDQPSFVLPREMLVKPSTYKRQLEAYRRFIVETAWLLAKAQGSSDVTRTSIVHDVEEMVEFEMKLANLVSPQEMRRNVLRTYNSMTLRELQDWSDLAAPNEIDWMKFMKRLTANLSLTIDWTERLIVRETDFVFKCIQLIKETPPRAIANFMHWGVVRHFAKDLTSKLHQLTFEFERVLSGAKNDQPKWKECIQVVYSSLHMALGYSYVQKHFDNTAKLAALEMSDNIKSVFSEELGRVDWMDKTTKDKARHKVAAMSRHIGYPAWFSNSTAMEHYYKGLEISDNHFNNVLFSSRFKFYKNFNRLRNPVDRDEFYNKCTIMYTNHWRLDTSNSNGFLRPPTALYGQPFVHNDGSKLEHIENRQHESESRDSLSGPFSADSNSTWFSNIELDYEPCRVFPAAILQPPFFRKGRLEALNYGGIGVIIAHEITHAFDDIGRQFDAEGNLAQWWTENTIETYLNKSQCFVQQYGNYRISELDGMLNAEAKLNGATTLGENIADNGGLHSALAAYRKYVAKNGPEPSLPGLESYSAEQLFFIAFANNWCESSTKESLLDSVLTDSHSPHRYRVLGTIENSQDFPSIFGCPRKKVDFCVMW